MLPGSMQDEKFWLPRRRRRSSLTCLAGYLIERGLCGSYVDIDGGMQCDPSQACSPITVDLVPSPMRRSGCCELKEVERVLSRPSLWLVGKSELARPRPSAQSPPYPLLGRGELYLYGRDVGRVPDVMTPARSVRLNSEPAKNPWVGAAICR